MNWQDIKGINTIMDFSGYYMEHGLIHKNSLFNNPDRDKWGYLWEISPEHISGVEKNVGENFLGILITNDLDARVFQGLFNRVFFMMNKSAIIEGVKSLISRPQGKKQLTNTDLDKLAWTTYHEIFTSLYSSDYIPLRKYLSQPVGAKIWIPLFPEYSHMDKLARKGYYQLIKWIIGNEPIIIELPSKYEISWIWESVILDDGPMENPELLFMEDFAVEFPGSIKYIPKNIVEKIGVQPLGDLDYFGISFH